MKRAAKACYNFISQNYSVCKVLVIWVLGTMVEMDY